MDIGTKCKHKDIQNTHKFKKAVKASELMIAVPPVHLDDLPPDILLRILRLCGGTSSLAVKCLSQSMRKAATDALSLRLAQHGQFLWALARPCAKCKLHARTWTDVRDPQPGSTIRIMCSGCLYFTRLKLPEINPEDETSEFSSVVFTTLSRKEFEG